MTDAPRWDRSLLYAGPADPQLRSDMDTSEQLARAFAARWRGRVGALSEAELAEALRELEAIHIASRRPSWYASLLFALDTESDEAQAALAATQAVDSSLHQQLAFFHVELCAWDEARLDALPEDTPLSPWLHHLRYQASFSDHTLSEEAERTVARKDLTGKSAWVNLYTQVTGGITFDVEGEGTGLTRADLGKLGQSPDRSRRERARDALAAGYAPHRPVLGFVFNTLFEDHRLDHAERKYAGVTGYTLRRDELAPAVFDALLEASASRASLMHRLHAARASALGLEDYATWDFGAPAFGDEPTMDWAEAAEVVTAAFAAFDADVGAWVGDYLTSGRVDVPPRPGKSSGGFCSPGLPPDDPFLLLNHADRLDDVFTLAHEVGHALHFHEAAACPTLDYWPGTALAETASNFGEQLLHEELLRRWTDAPRRRQLLHRFVRDGLNSALVQSAHVRFERAAHAERAGGVVALERFGELWDAEMSALYGPNVRSNPDERWRWITIPHFIFARFYCYSYAFGRLLTLALERAWRHQGDAFVPAYRALLAGGGSVAPSDALRPFGIDLEDASVWADAFAPLEAAMDELEALNS